MAKAPKSEAAILRQKAEELLRRNPLKSAAPKSEAELRKLIHELEVHQLELEMQNEELVLAKEQAELSFQKYIELKESVPTEEELQENNLRLELAMRAAKMAWWKMDSTTGNVTFGSRKAEMLGYPPEKFVHFTDFTALLHPDDYERTMKAMQNHLDGLIDKYEVEYRMLTKSNGYQWFYDMGSVVKKNVEGKPLIVTGLVIDISDRKMSELAMNKSETHLRTLVQTIPDLIWLKDTEGVYLSCNTRFENFFGAKEADIIGKTDYDFVDRDLAESFRQNDRIAMEAGKPTSNEEWVPFAADGHLEFLETIKTPMYDIIGNLIGVLGIARNITERKKFEDALFESEIKYRAFFENSMDANLLTNGEGKTLSVNQGACSMFGYSEEELINLGRPGVEDITDDRLSVLIEERNRNGKARGEVILLRKDGSSFPAEISTVTFKNQQGLKRSSMIIRDLSTHKKDEQKVRESEERFRAIFNQAPIAIALIDMKGYPIISNLPLSEMLGYSSDELTKMKFTEFTHPEDIDKDLSQFADLLVGKISGYNMEKRYIHKNGDLIWANLFVNTLSDNTGMPGEIIGMVEDITEKKLVEKEITMLAHSLKSINECVSITDLDNKIIFVNESFLKTYGYEINELLGKNINVVRSQTNEQKMVDEILPATILGEWQGELLNRRKDGSEFPIYLSTTIIKDKDDQPLGLIGVAIDISERKNSEKELLEAKNKAVESDRLKSAFLANMSHEVRTPLNSIIGFSELLNDPFFEEDDKNEFIQHIISSGNNLLTIISDIMDISKLESAEIKVHKSQINVQKFLSIVKGQFAIQVEGKKLELNLNHPDHSEETEVFADAERLKQIFNNLISNAIKFTMNGSIEIGYQPKGEMVEFYIKDTGIGIPAEFHDTIFERFRQVEAGNSRKYGGSGLGLAISKSLIELMGGKIWVVSESGVGSIFYFTLPIFNNELPSVKPIKSI